MKAASKAGKSKKSDVATQDGTEDAAAQAKAEAKCVESMWKLTLYTSFTIYELVVATQFPWFWDHSKLWDDWPYVQYPCVALTCPLGSIIPQT